MNEVTAAHLLDDSEFRNELRSSNARFSTLARGIERIQSAPVNNAWVGDRSHTSAAELIHMLDRAVRESDKVPHDTFVSFVSTSVLAIANLGVAKYSRHDAVVEVIDSAVSRFEGTGESTVELLLAKADFVSFTENEGKLRLQTLREAESRAAGVDLLEVRYRIAWYLVNASLYGRAIRLCNQSIAEISSLPNANQWRAAFLACRGIAGYTTLNRPEQARSDLNVAIEILSPMPPTAVVSRSLSEALHYLGRLEHDDGKILNSLELYIEGQRVRGANSFESRATAFYHIRMAETLLGVRLLSDADQHLAAAEELLNSTGDRGAGQVWLKYARANQKAALGDLDGALTEMKDCVDNAKQCQVARGRLMALARICTLRWQKGEVVRSALTPILALPLLLNGELRRNSMVGFAGKFSQYAGRVIRPYVPTNPTVAPLNCPCKIHAAESPSREVPPSIGRA